MMHSITHVVLIPSFNTGSQLIETVRNVLDFWHPVWVVIDGSTDGSERAVQELAAEEPDLRVIVRAKNGGKGEAVLTGARAALAAGFTHVLTMDSDGQHPVEFVPRFMETSWIHPEMLVLGRPIFGPEAPVERLQGRKLSNGLARLEVMGPDIEDSLFGFRVYPAAELVRALGETRYARGFDFDPEIAVRLVWNGVPTINLPAPCVYLLPEDGGVSHFSYLRDNLKLVWLHLRLLSELVTGRWIQLRRMRKAQEAESASG